MNFSTSKKYRIKPYNKIHPIIKDVFGIRETETKIMWRPKTGEIAYSNTKSTGQFSDYKGPIISCERCNPGRTDIYWWLPVEIFLPDVEDKLKLI